MKHSSIVICSIGALLAASCGTTPPPDSSTSTGNSVPVRVQIGIDQPQPVEGTPFNVEMKLDKPAVTPLTLIWSLNPPDARFSPTSGTIIMAKGEELFTLPCLAAANQLYDGDQSIRLEVHDQQVTLPSTSLSFVLKDIDPQPFLSVSGASGVGGSLLIFPVSLSNPASHDATFSWNTVNATAVSGTDYQGVSASAVIPAGQVSTTLSVVTMNHIQPGNRAFAIQMFNPTDAKISSGSATGTIESGQVLSATVGFLKASASVAENSQSYDIAVTLSSATNADVRVQFELSGTALSPQNYSVQQSEIVVPAGQTLGLLHVTLTDDGIYENTRDLNIKLIGSTNAQLAGQLTFDLAITNITPMPIIAIQDATGNEGSVLHFAISLNNVSGEDTLVSVKTSDGTAKQGQYTPILESVMIPRGQTVVSVAVATTDDGIYSDRTRFTASLAQVSGATIGRGSAIGTIVDSDARPTIAFSAAGQTIPANQNSAMVTLSLSAPAGVDVKVPITVSGTAVAGVDHNLTNQTVTIPAGSKTVIVTFQIFNHGPPAKTISIQMGTPDQAESGSITTQVIQI